ncbi:hypothetical protein IQ06DRAFT_292152 [Phaeosphaeriaceae sp. SRC1lsM3a]|nr:hypothetical protein IQ06DRAFT_292152 [Stagonospora sp. SRC1lsM3a]
MDPPSLKHARPASNSCKTGDFSCDLNLYRLLKCNANHKWEMSQKCTYPGDCEIDGPGKAHCARGGIDPPKLSRRAQCTPGSLACDKERRFLFTCGAGGQWEKDPLQCFGPGYCRSESGYPLMCGGFPQFGGQQPTCKSHCESMDYLYCIAVSEIPTLRYRHWNTNSEKDSWNDPAKIAKCKEGMCEKSDVSIQLR